MTRLFVAADLPAAATAALAHIRPPAAAGVRLAEPGQMHLTLHYLGEREVGPTAAALATCAAPAFEIDLDGVGQFTSPDGSVTLWAGVRESEGLLRLHAAVAAALAATGFRPEARRYTPHVTLARCGPGAGAASEFLDRHAAFSLPGVRVAGFGVYSSVFVGDAPVYRQERAFPLT